MSLNRLPSFPTFTRMTTKLCFAVVLISSAVLTNLATAKGAPPSIPPGFKAADLILQTWELADHRITASAQLQVSGKPGDQFVLLRAPSVLTNFSGPGLRVTQHQVEGALAYIVSVGANPENPGEQTYTATFEFQLDVPDPIAGFTVPTGPAAVQEVELSYEKPDWQFTSPSAVRIRSQPDKTKSVATILLGATSRAHIAIKPQTRDLTAEEAQFYVEGANLYLPSPGVIDGRHRINIRPSQGQVSSLEIAVPAGITVSNVTGSVGSWQFDADSGKLDLVIEPPQSKPFSVMVESQRSLATLPTDVELAPLTVADSAGEVGLLALAFGADAQPEKADSELSAVNLSDFDASLVPGGQTLHRVFRYGEEGGLVALRAAPVSPEVRVTTQQVLSLGDERIVLNVNVVAEITRAGLFQLSFPLPTGLEIESLTGTALHHWAELAEDDQNQIILHLNGKTIGRQEFAITMTGAAPSDGDWELPRFFVNEANRQTGNLVVRPTTGIRLRTTSRQNVSEVDPRSLGGEGKGALAFRLLQGDWNLILGIEKLDPWVTGQVLHEITLREGQTRTAILGNFQVQNASIRTLTVRLPITDPEEIKSVRAWGSSISDMIRTAPDSDLWEIQFKRRVVGDVQVRIEYERRSGREDNAESLALAEFPEARQLSYHYAVRAGGRLEIEVGQLPKGWQRADWNAVPASLREAGDRSIPALALRAVSPDENFTIRLRRHSLADALKLRVANGHLTTVLSPMGDQLTEVGLNLEVIQRSSLTITLPNEGELFSIFVNGESVSTVRQGDAYQFYILPGGDDRTANVRFVYSIPGSKLRKLDLVSPLLNVPLEQIEWRVLVPAGFELADQRGNMELKSEQATPVFFGKADWQSKSGKMRVTQARQAEELLEQANQYLQKGEQGKAKRALSSVANQYALDAASNEDARVQLENLQTQQAVVGLNTRRQRLYLDNRAAESDSNFNDQLAQGAAANPILQQGDTNFRPQEISQLLQGNTTEENTVLQRIAGRLVKHQKATEPAPQAITITLPEEGHVYEFSRTVQVNEDALLRLKLLFEKTDQTAGWRLILLGAMLVLLLAAFWTSVSGKARTS